LYYEVTGEKGHLLVSHQFSLRYKQAAPPRSAAPPAPDQVFAPAVWGADDPIEWTGYVADVANFLAAVRGEAPDRSPIAASIGTLEACEAVYRQLRALGIGP
jgi:hypothetical protein